MSVKSFFKKITKGDSPKGRSTRRQPATQTAKQKKTQAQIETATVTTPAQEKNNSLVVNTFMAKRIGLRPLMTEKGVSMQSQQQVVFRVVASARKDQIRLAVREKYKVKPLAVRTVSMPAKRRTRGRVSGFTAAWKKAYVTVPDVTNLKLAP